MSYLKNTLKWIISLLMLFILTSGSLYFFTKPSQDKKWTIEQALLPSIQFQNKAENPTITIKNIRDFQWTSENNITQKKVQYQEMQFQLSNIVGLKAVVSHFSAISEIAHVFMIIILDDGREFGVSIEARREINEPFSIHGGLLAQFEIMYVLATPDDLLGIRKINKESVHIYPIKVTPEKAQELFTLIAKDVNALTKEPELYHLFFKNCTNQLVKHVSILTERKYPWYFQTLAPGNTGKTLFDLDLIDMPAMSFEEIQIKTLVQ